MAKYAPKPLTAKQERAAALLAVGDMTQSAVAEELGVSFGTISRWVHQEAFKVARKDASDKMVTDKLMAARDPAVKRLVALLDHKDPYVVIQAAREILNRTGVTVAAQDAQDRQTINIMVDAGMPKPGLPSPTALVPSETSVV